jgi:hypothetical protein
VIWNLRCVAVSSAKGCGRRCTGLGSTAGRSRTYSAGHRAWVSRLLSGKRNANELHVAAFLAVCRITGSERDRLLALCKDRHTPSWLQHHGSGCPGRSSP